MQHETMASCTASIPSLAMWLLLPPWVSHRCHSQGSLQRAGPRARWGLCAPPGRAAASAQSRDGGGYRHAGARGVVAQEGVLCEGRGLQLSDHI